MRFKVGYTSLPSPVKTVLAFIVLYNDKIMHAAYILQATFVVLRSLITPLLHTLARL